MPRGKGASKTGGRKPGTPNRRSTELLGGLIEHRCVPAEQIAKLLLSKDLHAIQKIEYWEKLLPYLYPQRKPIDPEGYLTPEQVAQLLGAQATKFHQALQQHISDAMTITSVMGALRVNGHAESHS